MGWPAHFQRHAKFECVPVNVLDRRLVARIRGHVLARFGCFDAVVLLHSVFSNARCISDYLVDAVGAASQPKAYFIGNEYKLIPEKMEFCDRLGVSLLVTMNPSPRAQQLYRERLGCSIVCISSAGLDAEVFCPVTKWADRPIELGYRAAESPLYLGHNERQMIADTFREIAPRYGLKADISLESERRLAVPEWAAFLNRCKGQLGTEAGGDYFELTDATRKRVNAYLHEHPEADMHTIHELFFRDYKESVPVRTISGRHVEAAATKTVQVLLEGFYSGYLLPDKHYIPLKKDFSNVDEAVEKFRDGEYCRKLTDAAYEVAVSELTYEKLIDKFYDAFRTFI